MLHREALSSAVSSFRQTDWICMYRSDSVGVPQLEFSDTERRSQQNGYITLCPFPFMTTSLQIWSTGRAIFSCWLYSFVCATSEAFYCRHNLLQFAFSFSHASVDMDQNSRHIRLSPISHISSQTNHARGVNTPNEAISEHFGAVSDKLHQGHSKPQTTANPSATVLRPTITLINPQ